MSLFSSFVFFFLSYFLVFNVRSLPFFEYILEVSLISSVIRFLGEYKIVSSLVLLLHDSGEQKGFRHVE